MKKLILLAGTYCAVMLMISCGNKQQSQAASTTQASAKDTSKPALLQAVRAVEAKLKTTPTLDSYTANLAITAYLDYAKHFPDDTLSAAFLFNAGGLASSTSQYPRAVTLYQNVTSKFPQSRLVPECLLVEGFIFDNDIHDTANARKKYNELIQKFPNDSLSIQAKQAIKFLGKTPDEIGKMFEEQNKQKTKGHKKTQA
jgi:hypothetical protein